jgi:hypothetical protein
MIFSQQSVQLALQHPELIGKRQLGRVPRSFERKQDIFYDAPARTHDDDAIPQKQGFSEVMRDENDAAARAFPQAQELGPGSFTRLCIKRSKRFVHQHQVRIERPCPRQGHTLPHALRQLPWITVFGATEAKFAHQFLGAHATLGPAHSPDFQPDLDITHGDEADYGIVHLISIDENNLDGLTDYLGDKTSDSLHGSAAVDHLAFLATDLLDMRRRLHDAGLDYRERTVPNLGLHQVFVKDPSGVTIELNFPAAEAVAMQAGAITP